jgi:hypothetical protein
MDLSRKLFVASFVCLSFLAYGIGCSVEDRDIEKGGVFVCRTDDDCLKGSECVKTKKDDAEGKCTRSEEVKHCLDNDGDGFIGVSVPKSDSRYTGYVAECGFSSKNLQDPDDDNPTIYPGAPELCDGVDNSGDGCVDGECKNESGSCELDPDSCVVITMPCWGTGAVSDYDKSVCSASKIGMQKCVNGEIKVVKPDGTEVPNGCPTSTEQIQDYSEQEEGALLCNGIDDNCNGIVDEGCVKCSSILERMKDDVKCVVVENGAVFGGNQNYTAVSNYCTDHSLGDCPCLGTYQCDASDQGQPFCGHDNGDNIKTLNLTHQCINAFKSN